MQDNKERKKIIFALSTIVFVFLMITINRSLDMKFAGALIATTMFSCGLLILEYILFSKLKINKIKSLSKIEKLIEQKKKVFENMKNNNKIENMENIELIKYFNILEKEEKELYIAEIKAKALRKKLN